MHILHNGVLNADSPHAGAIVTGKAAKGLSFPPGPRALPLVSSFWRAAEGCLDAAEMFEVATARREGLHFGLEIDRTHAESASATHL